MRKTFNFQKSISFFLTLSLIFQVVLLFVPNQAQAVTKSWDFSSSSDYTFDNTKIEFSSGQAQLKPTSSWYNNSWSRRKEITITGASTSIETNYQVKITVAYDSDMQADFDDIRFTSSDGTTLIDHWLESKTDSTTADFWVEIPSIPASPGSTTIYIYYGNSGASSTSNGDNTFVFFDDFTNTKTHLFPYGSDSGWMSGFDPVSRRFYFFGSVTDNLLDLNVTPWVNIDTWEVGFVYPPLTISGAGVIYNPTKQKFYIYGGTDDGTPINRIYSFDPATEVFTQLSETLPDSVFNPQPVLDPTSGKVYIFGGRTSFSGSTQFVNRIAVHNLDLETPTVTDTTAVLPTASDGMEPVFSTTDNKIYLFGGAYNNGTSVNSLNSILSYNPSTPTVSPVDTGVDMASALDTMSSAYYNGNVYLFGGYNFTNTSYYSTIQKFNVTNQTIETLSASMYKADDDAKAFYDSVTGKIYVGPTLHSTASQNEDERKVVVLEFDPTSETLATEPSLGTTPTGWTSIGNAPIETPREVGGSYMGIADHYTDSYVGAKRSFSQLSGVNMLEFKASVSNSIDNNQFYLGPTDFNFLVNSAVSLRNRNTTNWEIVTGVATGQTITSISNGYHILGALVDVTNQKQYGLVDRANKTSALDWLNADQTLTTVVINSSTGGIAGNLVDWVLIRKSTTGSDPSTSIGSEVTLYSVANPTIYSQTTQTFTSLSFFTEVATKNGGEIKYQISNDGGTTWYWYNSGWTTTVSGYTEANTASDINSNISTFTTGSGEFLFKAYLHSDGSQLVQLNSVDISGIPFAPTIGTSTVLSSSSIRWNFIDNSDDETGFRIYDGTDTLVTFSATADLSYLDETGLSENTQYSGRYVTAYNNTGNSTSSSVATTKYTLADTPTNFSASSNSNSVTLTVDSFSNDTSGQSGYYFSRSGANSGWIQTNSWTDTGLSCGSSYTYSVKYRNGDGTETSEISASKSTSGCGGGSGSPAIWILPTIPSSGFKMSINNGALVTSNRNVILGFNTGTDIKKMAISMTGDFTDAIQEDYIASKQWDLCSKFGGFIKNSTCPDGKYTVYAQFYTAYGRTSSNAFASSAITLKSGTVAENLQQYTNLPFTNLFTKYLRYRQTNSDIKRLQIFLNTDPDTKVSDSGAGSPGKETNYFGPLTYKAVIRFQEKYTKDVLAPWGFVKGTGYVGRTTLAKINELMKK